MHAKLLLGKEITLLPSERPKLYGLRGSHRLEQYLNLEGFFEKSLKMKYALKSTGKSHKGLEKSLISYIFCRN